MYQRIFNKINLSKNLKNNFYFKRKFSDTKEHVEIKYIKEGKKKYMLYTAVASLSLSIGLTYGYENFVLYKWNNKYDYSYNPDIQLIEKKAKEKKEGKRDKKHVAKNIILVRHGQYERKNRHDEDSKRLTKQGCKQADITGKKLKDILNNKKISVIYHSDLIRAKETAQIISKYFPNATLINDPNLNEGTPYLPDPIPKSSKFDSNKIMVDSKRINKAYETYFYQPTGDEDEYQLVICHGNVIRYFLCRALQLPLFAWLRFSSYNCGITWLVLDDDGSVILREFGSVAHLPFENVTYF
ncbi:phosphoglucomutase-2 [Plasmodium brasilianum]|uniref:Serine/threonine-protein phosphatase PGAM5, mitochondrial n=2 Tax=Plasmodium (Plasmodium) TaxID=418103 RepID=A0A1A8VTF3_PLAMA|nr:phosphoglucomutase-2, putative [Plasmodium malariae]KAI4840076.1 phosphoglucomutase-2 [Plasmodium brasilianum]SBS82957.1 phosphoglucomutase-2, putative (PGM2) [Plasmodium malariae]SBT74966.1 phosphoglucomutase-2, putative [Plasmodium malariae]SBT87439.1 phosphoglucomutase-2, putative [Plasmodium malariae]